MSINRTESTKAKKAQQLHYASDVFHNTTGKKIGQVRIRLNG